MRGVIMRMAKTYQLVYHEEPIPIDRIRLLYRGYWVFLTNASITEYNEVLSGIPVVIGKMAYDGADDGIYNKYRSEQYGECVDMSFLPSDAFIFALPSNVIEHFP